MRPISKASKARLSVIPRKPAAAATDHALQHLAFDNTVQANIITIVSSGKIIVANSAACKLLGYSKKNLITKSREAIFDINESGFKQMLKQRTAEGKSIARVTGIKKSGKTIPCEITSAVFMDEDGIEKAITTIADMSQSIQKQKNIDAKKEKIVADNITLAKSKQKDIDIRKEKIVADKIVLAKSKQKDIDTKKEKIVADNITLAKSKQKLIDIKKEKTVAHDILLAEGKSDARIAKNNEWIKYIARTSYDVMWDWDIITGEIYVGDSIEEVFGYKVNNNNVSFTDFTSCLLPGEKESVVKKLTETLNSRKKSWNDSYSFRRHDGSVASATCRASIIRDEKRKAIRLIGAIQDVSRLLDLENKLEEQITRQEENKFLLAAKISFDVIWDWNLLTNEVFIGEGFEDLFGYPIKNNKGTLADWGDHIHPDDKEDFDKRLHEAIASTTSHWEHAYRMIRADGSVARVFDRASIIRHSGGKAYRMIGAMQDISRQKELEEKLDQEIVTKGKLLNEYKESFKLIFNSSSDVLYDCDLVTNEVILSDAFQREFGYTITSHMTPEADWASHIHPEDKEMVVQDYFRMLGSAEIEWKCSYRFLRADGSVANVLSTGVVLRNAFGKAYRMIGSMQDVSKQKVLEEKLEMEIKLKENQIAEATQDAKDTERSDIGKELHDNINQLLSASKMYLEMAKRGGENIEMYLSRSSEYTLKAIDEIRKLSKGLTTDVLKNLGLSEAIETAASDAMEVNPVKISYGQESFMEHSVNDKFKLNIFRIVQEQLNNILKHSGAKAVAINLSQNKRSIVLRISDNGVGFDTGKKRKGIGIDNIKSRVASYDGTIDIVSKAGRGCVLTATFPVTDALLKKS